MTEKIAFAALVFVTLLLAKDVLNRQAAMQERAAYEMEQDDRMARIRAEIHKRATAGKDIADLGKILEEIK